MSNAFEFRLPGHDTPLDSPQYYISAIMRNFRSASMDLGAAVDTLVVRLASSGAEGAPDYQIQTRDGVDAVPYSGDTHEALFEDRTQHLDEDALDDVSYTLEHVEDWLNQLNGEGAPGGPMNPILSTSWMGGNQDSPKDSGPEG